MGIIDKKQMTEEDIKLNFITPAILSKGWQAMQNITAQNFRKR